MCDAVIVVGGGLSGLSCAHTIVERGGNVVLLDKMAFCGGNSTKATSGMNAAPTKYQMAAGITSDSAHTFFLDTAQSALKGNTPELAYETQKPGSPARTWPDPFNPDNNPYLCHNRRLAYESGPAAEWLGDKFSLDLTVIGNMAGQSFPRCHRGQERFPGMTITYGLLERYEELCEKFPGRCRLENKARVEDLIMDGGEVVGVRYEQNGTMHELNGPVVLCTGGFGADFSADGVLRTVRPKWSHLPTTNGEHCTGDGLKMAIAVGAGHVDLDMVQVHPTGLVHPDEPDAKWKFLAAEALRGQGGILIDREGNRFVDEMQKRDYVTGAMWAHNKAPYRLCLNSASAAKIHWHVKHYEGRGLMKKFDNGTMLAKAMNIDPHVIEKTLADYTHQGETNSCPYGKPFDKLPLVVGSLPLTFDDTYYVAIVTPVIHYCMGGIKNSVDAEVVDNAGNPIPGLFCAGEVAGGIHGLNRLGGSSLLDCVVFGRVSGNSAASCLLARRMKDSSKVPRSTPGFSLRVDPVTQSVTVKFDESAGPAVVASIADEPMTLSPALEVPTVPTTPAATAALTLPAAPPVAPPSDLPVVPAAAPLAVPPATADLNLDEVAKHNTDKDCWVAVNGQVLDVTDFLNDHPGGKRAIMLYAGKDASEEFNMLHDPKVVKKYLAPKQILGNLAASKL